MLKHALLPALAAATVIAAAMPAAHAISGVNGTGLNGTSFNGLSLNRTASSGEALEATRLTLPNGVKLTFR